VVIAVPSIRLARRVRNLVDVARRLQAPPAPTLDGLANEILAVCDGEDPRAGASRLNNDGVPLQLCLTATRRATSLRLIGDPGTHHADAEARHACALAALRRVAASVDAEALLPAAEACVARLVPADPTARAAYRNGFLWIAAGRPLPGFASYVELGPHGQAEGWRLVNDWLANLLPSMTAASAVLADLREHCVVASAGLEGSTPDDARAKIYFRLARPKPLTAIGLALLRAPEMVAFLRIAVGDHAVDLDGLVLSTGFQLATGALADVKVDLCGHCLAYAPLGWMAVVDRLTHDFGFAGIPLHDALLGHKTEVAFIGLGLDVERSPRLNLYLKSAERHTMASASDIAAALEDGIRYLLALQQPEGCWTDYALPTGQSDQWVTAYIGLALARHGKRMRHQESLMAARTAAKWLTEQRTYSAGWGYNAATGPDADSTAIALALLRELGWPVAAHDQAFLQQHWRDEGGLATYQGPGAWGTVHWDVTPLGYLGLSPAAQRALRPQFLRAIAANRCADGTWLSYWWKRPYYSTFTTLEALAQIGEPEPGNAGAPAAVQPADNAFDLACIIGSDLLRGPATEDHHWRLHSLLAWQQEDGRWPGHANLRVTDDGCYAPWNRPVGECYADLAGTITTATVVRVLMLQSVGPCHGAMGMVESARSQIEETST